MNWKIIIKPIKVGWLSSKPKATNNSLRPIRTANREKHKKEFICRKVRVSRYYLHISLHLCVCIWSCVIRPTFCFVLGQALKEKSARISGNQFITWLMTIFLTVWPSFQWPSSWPRTARISELLHPCFLFCKSIRKRTILLDFTK